MSHGLRQSVLTLVAVVAMLPDFLFQAGIAHRRWMEVFVGHISSHSSQAGT